MGAEGPGVGVLGGWKCMYSIVDCKGNMDWARWLCQGANPHGHRSGGKHVIRALNNICNAVLELVSKFRTVTTLQIPYSGEESSGHLA